MENDTQILIGKNCMFSSHLVFSCTDCHSILDMENNLLNRAKTIEVGDHVWIGRNVTLTKSAKIPNGCVIGFNSVVAKKFEKDNCAIAGNPAKVIKENIKWHSRKPDLYEENQSDEHELVYEYQPYFPDWKIERERESNCASCKI